MLRLLFNIILLLTLFNCTDTANDQTKHISSSECPSLTVRFSPKGGVTQSIVESIEAAEHEVIVHAFAFTSVPIAESLIKIKKQGKYVAAVLDRENLHNKNSVIKLLESRGIEIFIDDKHAIAHNKVIIIDKIKVFTGSFNFSKSAEEHNAENSISIVDAKIAAIYFENWSLHKSHSYLFSPD